MDKKQIRLTYKKHQFRREPDWHKLQVIVWFVETDQKENKKENQIFLIEISDMWLSSSGGARGGTEISDGLLCKVLSIVADKVQFRAEIPKDPISVNAMENSVGSFSSLSTCEIVIGKKMAVLTGDIVSSRKLDPKQFNALQKRLKLIAEQFESRFPGSLIGTLCITQGDAWQVALRNPERALHFALFLRAIVKAEFGADSRVAIGVGFVERLDLAFITESTGAVFEYSGIGLETLKTKKDRMWYQSLNRSARLEVAEQLLVLMLDKRMSSATKKQSILLQDVLLIKKQEEIAKEKGLSQSTVSETLAAVKWGEMKEILDYFEKNLKNEISVNLPILGEYR